MEAEPAGEHPIGRSSGAPRFPPDGPTVLARIPLIVAAAFFMETLDGTIIATALPAIARSLGESTLDLAASITVYLVAMAVFVPTAGWASDRFGARNLFAAAVAVFTLASLLCGLQPDPLAVHRGADFAGCERRR